MVSGPVKGVNKQCKEGQGEAKPTSSANGNPNVEPKAVQQKNSKINPSQRKTFIILIQISNQLD